MSDGDALIGLSLLGIVVAAFFAFSLWGGGNYAAYAWGNGPDYIAEYACQGAFILEKVCAYVVVVGGGWWETAGMVTRDWLLPLHPQ